MKKFSELVQNNRVEFFGGIDVGLHISLNVIQTFFDITIIATGAYHPKYLNLPGFDGKNIFTSKDLVSSYNNDPIHSPIRLNLKSARKALIIGQGNVSLDIARILLKDPEELWKTDISLKFLKELVMSALRKIHIIGRRGPLEVSCAHWNWTFIFNAVYIGIFFGKRI